MRATAIRTAARAPRRVALGAVLTAWLAGLVLVAGPGGAQAAAGDEPETAPLEVEATRLYAHPVTDAPPPTLTDSIPPQAVCAIVPEVCPTELDALTGQITGGIDLLQEHAQVAPAQPVPPGHGAVGYLAGNPRYETALRFALPAPPEGEEYTSVRLRLPMGQPTYDLHSPVFQDLFLAAFEALGDQDPAVFAERLPEVLQQDPLVTDAEVVGVEACPLTAGFEAQGAPQATHRDERPDVQEQCLDGGAGRVEDGELILDLTGLANQWAEGEIERHGVLLSPTGAPNLAFGDPDLSTSAQLTFGLEEARVEIATAEALDLDAFAPPESSGAAGGSATSEPPDTSAMAPPADGGSGGGGAQTPAPEIASGGGPGGGAGAGAEAPAPETAAPAMPGTEPAGVVDAPWWIWLLVPLFAGGAYLVSSALTAPVVLEGSGAPGALSRLVEQFGGR